MPQSPTRPSIPHTPLSTSNLPPPSFPVAAGTDPVVVVVIPVLLFTVCVLKPFEIALELPVCEATSVFTPVLSASFSTIPALVKASPSISIIVFGDDSKVSVDNILFSAVSADVEV
jgi:hypothetical protein